MTPPKKAKLRAIDRGTRYDVTGSLKRIARQIERGEHGDVRDVVVIYRSMLGHGAQRVNTYHFGTGDFAQALLLVESAKKDIT